MLYFIAFVICGGPLAVLEYKIEKKRRTALLEIKKLEDQLTEHAMRATNPKKRGRKAKSGGTSSVVSTPTPKSDKFSFGL
jgi:hypothetical protein